MERAGSASGPRSRARARPSQSPGVNSSAASPTTSGIAPLDAAIWLDPDRPETIAAALRRLLGDRAGADALRARGRERVAAYSWRAAAEATARCYERALKTRRYAAR